MYILKAALGVKTSKALVYLCQFLIGNVYQVVLVDTSMELMMCQFIIGNVYI